MRQRPLRHAVADGLRFIVRNRLDVKISGNHQDALDLLRGKLLAIAVRIEYRGDLLNQVKEAQTVELIALYIALGKLLQCTVAGEKRNKQLSFRILNGDQIHLDAFPSFTGFDRILADDIDVTADERL